MVNRCSCCAGTQAATPLTTANRPGLNALVYRAGTHFTFFETMKARLSNLALKPNNFDQQDASSGTDTFPLHDLKTREVSDPAIALLDSWAVVADVLTFYQERIANEGYLRTATERRSILELARLIGYELRPGVAASVYLAYTLDDNSEPLEIPAGARSQSVPGPGELPQSFESSDSLKTRREWNNLKPRMARPQRITLNNALTVSSLYFAGTETKLRQSDSLLLVFGDDTAKQILRRVHTVVPDFDNKLTQVVLEEVSALTVAVVKIIDKMDALIAGAPKLEYLDSRSAEGLSLRQELYLGASPISLYAADIRFLAGNLSDVPPEVDPRLKEKLEDLGRQLKESIIKLKPDPPKTGTPQTNVNHLLASLSVAPSLTPLSSSHLARRVSQVFNRKSDTHSQLLVEFNPLVRDTFYPALANATFSVSQPPLKAVYALRVTAPLFGYSAPKITFDVSPPPAGVVVMRSPDKWEDPKLAEDEESNRIYLDGSLEQISANTGAKPSYIIVNRLDVDRHLFVQKFKILEAKVRPRTAYGLSKSATALTLDGEWWKARGDGAGNNAEEFTAIRDAVIYAQSEELALADEPINAVISGSQIELGALYNQLKTGRWLIVSGERADIPGVSGVKANELVMLAGIKQSRPVPGDKTHTTLILANSLAYTYKRATVTIYGNVVKATHGETRNEVLGAGDASKALQEFTLKQPPVTYVSAPTIKGIASTLHVYVNEVEWHETASLVGLAPADHRFITLTDDEARTTVVFGNGREGARLPTGLENVKAVYRNGIGKPGNVQAGQISLLTTRPLGVKEVINPLRASGGADKESRDQARRNAPLAVMSLDRLVSTQDYADFARTFAGIGKASATRLSDGHRRLVHLTIAGADDIPIDERSDLYRNLRQSFGRFGDPFQAVQIDVRELVALVISANVRLLPDYQWEAVEPNIRGALLSRFSFDERELGQPVFLSEVISTVQQVAGVAYVDVDLLDGVSETDVTNPSALSKKLALPTDQTGTREQVVQPRQHIRVGLAQTAAMDPARAKLTTGKSIFPAQLAILLPGVPDTLILNLVQEVR